MNLKTNKLRDAITFAIVAGVAATAGSGVAFAQQSGEGQRSQELDRLTITGSRIRSVDTETSQPVLVLTREAIEQQGLTSVAEVLQNISAAGAAINRTFNNGGDGSAGVSLRNLGAARTLVLVDGRRWVTTLGGSADLNTVPASIIERVEVLKDGASAIYGSDAIAGAINIITRENYDGAEVRGHYGQFNQGDGERSSVDATIGTSSERGNVVLNVSRVEESAVMAGDRLISRDPVFGRGSALYSGYSASGRIWNPAPGSNNIVPDNAPGIGPAGQQRYAVDSLVPYNAAQYAYNYALDNYLLTPQTRTSAYAKGRFDVTDNVTFRSQALYSERRSEQQLAGFPLHGGAMFGRPDAAMSGDSYFNPYNTLYGGDGRDVQWSHRLTEQARVYNQDVRTFHTYIGFEGDFTLGNRLFGWDAGYSYSKTDRTDRQRGDANMRNVALGVGPSELRDGRVVCVDAPGGNVIAGCVPFNPLSPAGAVTQEMLDYILFTAQSVYQNRSESVTANITGELFNLPGGMAQFAAGVESRKESGFDSPDAFVSAGYSSGNARTPTSGSYSLNEVYGEVLLPILADIPGAQLFEISLASRYSDYSNFGSTTNSKFGMKWKPFQDLMVRGSWAQGFRAPSITNLYRGLADSYIRFGDICSADYGGRNATIAASCAAAGVPADFIQRTNAGEGYYGQTIFPFSLGGNPNLQPETSVSRTLGFVYSPSFVDGLNVSVDWWRVDISDAIDSPTADYVLDQCYNGGDPAYCGLFTRRSDDFQIGQMLLAPLNLNKINAEGWDLSVAYRTPETSVGRFSTNFDASYMSKWESGFSTDAELESAVGRYKQSDPNWRLRANASLDWSVGDWGVTWMTRYMSGLVEACPIPGYGLCSDETRRIETGPAPRNKLGAATYHDVQGRFNTPWNSTVKVGVNNVFRKVAPVAYQAFANSFDPQYPVPDSRYMYIEYQHRF